MKSKTECRYAYKNRKKEYAWIYFLLPSITGITLLVVIPFVDVIRRSFLTPVTQEFVGIKNYQIIFQNEAFLLAAKNTLRFAGICLPLLLIISLLFALLLSEFVKIQFLKAAYLLPLAIPTTTIVLVWKIIFFEKGMINGFLQKIGIGNVDFTNSELVFWVLILSYLWKNLGYTIVLWLSGILVLQDKWKEAAKVDGASNWQSFYYVIFPNLKPVAYTITVISFLNTFKVFREAYLVAGSYPHKSIYLLQHLFNNWFVNLELNKMAAAAVVTAIIMFLFILLLQQIWEAKE